MLSGCKQILCTLTTLLLLWLGLRYVLPLCFPFLLGLAMALAAEPMVRFLQRLRLPRALGSGLSVTMAFGFLATLLLLLGAFLVKQLRLLSGALPDLEQAAVSGMALLRQWLLALAQQTPQAVQSLLTEKLTELFSDGAALLDKALRWGLGLAGNLLGRIPDSALGLGTAVLAGYMISMKLPRIRAWLEKRVSSARIRPFLDALKRMKQAVFGWLLAQTKLMGLTFLLLTLGLWILRIPHSLLWAAVIALVDAFPVLGTGTILLPWAAVAALQHDGGRAIGLLAIYGVISLCRSILEPKFLGNQLGLDPLVTLVALYIGYRLWGIGGMILSPLAAAALKQVLPQSS